MNVRSRIEALAREHGIAVPEAATDTWAERVTELSGDRVEIDDVTRLLIDLRRNEAISAREMVRLLGGWLDERDV